MNYQKEKKIHNHGEEENRAFGIDRDDEKKERGHKEDVVEDYEKGDPGVGDEMAIVGDEEVAKDVKDSEEGGQR
ncbi:hypothetical protein U1Q18_002982 [Sarracenia purpurea var. burkii]